MAQDLLSALFEPEHEAYEGSWSFFFMDVTRVQSLKEVLNPEDSRVTVLVQQLFRLLVGLYAKVECSRKEPSVPGSVGPQCEVVFDRQELQAASQSRRINMMGRGTFPSLNAYDRLFSPSTGRGFRFSLGKGRSYGYGSLSGKGCKGKSFRKGFHQRGKGPSRTEPAFSLSVGNQVGHFLHCYTVERCVLGIQNVFYLAVRQKLNGVR
jgi:hypothetical protein